MATALQGADPWFIDKSVNPREARAALAYVLGVNGAGTPEGGILPGAGLSSLGVSATSPSASMAVTVAAGSCVVPRSGGEHAYECRLPTAGNVDIAAADGTNPRIDQIVARIRDGDLSDPVGPLATRGFLIEVEKGTAAAVPVPKDLSALPPCLVLAEVRVDAGVTSIVSGKISDKRYFTRAAGAPRIDYNAESRAGNGPWDLRQRFSTGALDTWDSALNSGAGGWVPLADPRAWTSYTPTVVMTTPSGTVVGRYWRSGRRVSVEIIFTAGVGAALGTGAITVTLPFATASISGALWFGEGVWISGSFREVKLLATSGATTAEIFALSTTNVFTRPGVAGYTFGNGDSFAVAVEYECAAV